MLSGVTLATIIIVMIALIFDFINGFHDSANAIACSVSTRVLSLKQAIIMSAVLNFVGAFLNTKVAKTIGSGIVNPSLISSKVVIAALVGAIIWNLITWYYGIPSSSSHALIGGIIGAAVAYKGNFMIVHWSNLFNKVLIWIVLSPIIGFVIGYVVMTVINFFLRKTRPATVTKVFSKAQMCSAAWIAFNHGANDAQKSMGIIAMALVSGGFLTEFDVPTWVKISCACAMAIGTSFGGKKIIKTMGSGMAKLTPVKGFSAEMGASTVMFAATMLQAPVSTTHIITTSIMGVGASKRLSAVKWGKVSDIVTAWILTIPMCAIISAITMYVLKLF